MNIKKTLAILTALLSIGVTSVCAKSMEFTIGSADVKLSDTEISAQTLDCAPYTANDRTMVPLRFIAENFGAQVNWDEATKTVSIASTGKNIRLTIDSTTAYINGEKTELDVAPAQTSDRTMVPLRFISEKLGFDVYYCAPTEQVLVSNDAPYATLGDEKISVDDFKILYDANSGYYDTTTDENKLKVVDMAVQNMQFICQLYEAGKANAVTLSSEESDEIVKTINEDFAQAETQPVLFTSYYKFLEKYYIANKYSSEISGNINPTDEEISNFYNENFVCAKHILILNTTKNGLEKAKALRKRAIDGADFDKLMKENTEDPGSESQPNGYVFTKGQMVKEFEDASYALKTGEISPLVTTSYGYHIIKKCELPEITDELKQQIMYAIGSQKYADLIGDKTAASEFKQLITSADMAKLLK